MFRNSIWAIFSNIIQNVFLILFFIILARHYSTTDFAHFLISNTLYQFIACMSTMGLGQWFIREMVNSSGRSELSNQFLKIQLVFGVIFFGANTVLTFSLYDNADVHLLSIFLGVNIIFDNLIYSIRYINIADFNQKQTFMITALEAFFKLMVALVLFIYPMSIVLFGLALIAVRLVTFRYFLRLASTAENDISVFWRAALSFTTIKELVYRNWSFVIVGGISVLYWRIGNIIIAKTLSLMDVANYEISFKLFTVAQILPMVVITSIFPSFVKLYSSGDLQACRKLYRTLFNVNAMYGVISYAFVFTFSDQFVPMVFGAAYVGASEHTAEMFLTMLMFPTAFLQANILVSMKLEKFDMWFNFASLCLYVLCCFIGLHYARSLSAINISLFISFFIFHLLQDLLLIKRGITSFAHTLKFYAACAVLIVCFTLLSGRVSAYLIFAAALSLVLAGLIKTVSAQGILKFRSNPAKI